MRGNEPERRRVAVELRFAAIDGAPSLLPTLKNALGMSASVTYRDVLRRLADLIDPDKEMEE